MLPRHALLCLLLPAALFGSGSAAIRGKAVPLVIREIAVDLVEGLGYTTEEAVAYLSISHTNGATRFSKRTLERSIKRWHTHGTLEELKRGGSVHDLPTHELVRVEAWIEGTGGETEHRDFFLDELVNFIFKA